MARTPKPSCVGLACSLSNEPSLVPASVVWDRMGTQDRYVWMSGRRVVALAFCVSLCNAQSSAPSGSPRRAGSQVGCARPGSKRSSITSRRRNLNPCDGTQAAEYHFKTKRKSSIVKPVAEYSFQPCRTLGNVHSAWLPAFASAGEVSPPCPCPDRWLRTLAPPPLLRVGPISVCPSKPTGSSYEICERRDLSMAPSVAGGELQARSVGHGFAAWYLSAAEPNRVSLVDP